MPIYPHTCAECGANYEAFVGRMSAAATEPCPSCGSEKVERGFGLPARGPATAETSAQTNCRGDGPPCGASWCGRPGE